MRIIEKARDMYVLLKRAEGETPGPLDGVRPPARGMAPVSADQALGISTVFRGIQIHAVSASQLSIDVDRRDQTIPVPSLALKPCLDMSRSAWIEETVVSLATTGNAFWRHTNHSQRAEVIDLKPLNPHKVTVGELRDGTREYRYEGNLIPRANISHLELLRVPGRVAGLGPIQAAQVELGGVIDVRDYGAGWFRDGQAQPNGVLSTEQHLTGEQAKAYKQVWNDTADGGVRILGAGLTYSPIMLKPADAQWLESQQFNVTQVARLLGVPASLMLAVLEGSSQSYANVEQDWIAYIRFSLMAYLREIEEALSAVLPRGQTARFNVEALLRSDTKTRYESHNLGILGGWLRRSEVRAIEKLAPIEGIDDVRHDKPAA